MANVASKRPADQAKIDTAQADDSKFDKRRLQEFRDRHPPRKIEPMDSEAYARVLDEFMTLAGTEPDLVAPPRRRFD
jgi:hypothetical protein